MHTFRDTKDREWAVTIHVAALKRVRDLTGIDLYRAVTDGAEGIGALLGDPIAVGTALFALVGPQARERGVDEDAFAECLAGDAYEAAAHALVSELVDFFPNPRVRAGLRKVMEATRAATDRRLDKAEQEIEAALARLNDSSGGSPESSGSTPTP